MIEKVVRKVAEQWMDKNLQSIVSKVMGLDLPDNATMTQAQFICAIGRYCRSIDDSLTSDELHGIGLRVVNSFLNEEKISFGDLEYSWTRLDAYILAREYETDHWEG